MDDLRLRLVTSDRLRCIGCAPSLQGIFPVFNELPEPLRRAAYHYRRDLEIPWNQRITGGPAPHRTPPDLQMSMMLTTIDAFVDVISHELDGQPDPRWDSRLTALCESLRRARRALASV
jgi:hypothetical protein